MATSAPQHIEQTQGTPRTSDVGDVAAGSSAIFLGAGTSQALAYVLTLVLTHGLGRAGYGLYVATTTIIHVALSVSPLGLNNGIVALVARHRIRGDVPREKGVIILGLTLATISGLLVAAALVLTAVLRPRTFGSVEVAAALVWASPAVLFGTLTLYMVGLLWAVKAMKTAALTHLIALQAALLLGALVAVTAGLGVHAVLVAFGLAYFLSFLLTTWSSYPHFRSVLSSAGRGRVEAWSLLSISIPQTFADLAFRLNLWLDILMLTWLATLSDVGTYRAAVALTLVGNLPAVAGITMFKPIVAEYLALGGTKDLDALLKVSTRWLLVLAMPVFMVLALAPELALSMFGDGFAIGGHALRLLVIGQAIHVCLALTVPVLMMSCYAWVNMADGIVVLLLNFLLNYTLIPRYGIEGAAMASSACTAAWALLRVAQCGLIFRLSPFSVRSLWVVLAALFSTGIGHVLLGGRGVWLQAPAALLSLTVFGLIIGWLGTRPEDEPILERLLARLSLLPFATRWTGPR